MTPTTQEPRACVRIRVDGHVQGVGFRYFTQRQANNLGLSGYVRNAADGSVEAEAWGEQVALERFAELLQKGPGTGRVEHCTIDWLTTTSPADEFQIRT